MRGLQPLCSEVASNRGIRYRSRTARHQRDDSRSIAFALAFGFLFTLTLFFEPPAMAQRRQPDAPDQKKTVRVTVDYGDGVAKTFSRIPWKKGMTVLDAMEVARKHPRGIQFSHRGKGATAFLYRIDDLENEASGRGWIFRVNGELADRSFGIQPLMRGDAVLWKFEEYR